ncbi:hypothetical protein K488DRAFT_82868 [Vararia minispora EC-137]|uniref:Uncharacterized protein n=1 Tax=Vararia minispora EC-137 TaxID=1314806 RepID=A0ACB8QV50_9AGAM|nr:hypothetical protein K488DRAFT_82868 [Vararia minispora EC-137]
MPALATLPPSLRPAVPRRDTEAILSYYQSDLPGKHYHPHDDRDREDDKRDDGDDDDGPSQRFNAPLSRRKTSSSTASSSSVYSTPTTPPAYDATSSPFSPDLQTSSLPIAHRRRPSNQSTSDPDRRMAIVQTDTARFMPLSLDAAIHPALDAPNKPSDKRNGGVPDVAATTIANGSRSQASSATNPPYPRSHHPSSAPPHPRDLPTQLSEPRLPPRSSLSPHGRVMSDIVTPDSVRHRASSKNVRANHATDAGRQTLLDTSTPSSSRSGSRPRTPEDDASGMSTAGRVSHSHSASLPASDASVSNDRSQLPSYLRYEPGLHSTAGPLPPPPRATFSVDATSPPPPRPPRLRSPSPMVRQGVETTTPTSISGVLSPQASSSSLKRLSSEQGDKALSSVAEGTVSEFFPEDHAEQSPHHVREGAFMPSRIVNPPQQLSPHKETIRLVSSDMTPPPDAATDGLLPPALDGLPLSSPNALPIPPSRPDLQSNVSWVSVQIPSDPPSEYPSSDPESLSFKDTSPIPPSPLPSVQPPTPSEDIHSLEVESSGIRSRKEGSVPSYPTHSSAGVLTDDKRNSSLPRTPSYASSSTRWSRTPSPAPAPRPPRQKIRSRWPDAMWCRDIYSQRTSLERATSYAHKINELAMYDCGLADWVAAMRAGSRGLSSRSLPNASSRAISMQPRQVSRSSISSEATFPLRPDAYVATDLTVRPSDVEAPTSPPTALPYPALVGSPLTTTSPSNRLSFTAAQHAARSLPGGGKLAPGAGFFSSIGRNYSLKKDGRVAPTNRLVKPHHASSQSPGLKSSSPLSAQPPPTRPQIMSTPTVPGGPRAAPGRMARSQTLMLPPSPSTGPGSDVSPPAHSPSTSLGPQPRRRSNTLKRPSLFGSGGPRAQMVAQDSALAADFQVQVDKLTELVPHADRDVLASYLRRAGQDILAIGQYLEDEKNGTLRRD